MINTEAMSIDAAKPSPGGLSISELERFLSDMRQAPQWRQRADLECDYYDGNQHTAESIQEYTDRNLPIVTVNLIAPVINLIIGMEAQTRTDWTVKSDGSQVGLTPKQADGLSAKLNEAERNTYADQACADAYASQAKAGIGWVEVSRNTNPFEYKYRCNAVDRREIWWDMRSKDRLLRDCRWLVRKKWNDLDVVLSIVPDNLKKYVEAAVHNPAGWDMQAFNSSIPMVQDALFARDWMADPSEWCDSERRRVCAYEVWYRVPANGLVIKFQDGRVDEFDKKNPIHIASLASRVATVEWAYYQKMRMSWWVGPFRLMDMPSPYGINEFPYVPFWGYMEDATRTPYGMIRAMKSLQDEVNARRAQMMWQLSAKRVIAEDDAVDDHDAAAQEVNRPDAYIKLKNGRKQRGSAKAFEVIENTGMSTQQFNVYQDSKQSLQQAGGVYGPMLGDGNSGAEAGVAIDQLIQQGTTTLAGINSNYRFGRTEVGRKLLRMVVDDMKGQETRVTLPKNAPSGGLSVTFNRRTQNPNGLYTIDNDTSQLLWTVALADVPSSPTYNQRRLQDLVEFAKSLPDDLKGVFADLVVMASDLPNKDQIAERIRRQLNIAPQVDPATATEEERAELKAYQDQQEKQAKVQELAQAIELEEQASKGAVNRAKVDLIKAQTEGNFATVGLTRAQTIEALLGLNIESGAAEPGTNKEGKGMPAAPKLEAPEPEETAEAASQVMDLEQPQHDDRISLGSNMPSSF